jgi:hypothetical protein
MRDQAIRAIVFAAILALLAADFTVGCGKNAYVYGPVTQKYTTGANSDPDKMIEIGGQTYLVPPGFYTSVQVGDIVRFNGHTWSIVKKADTPAPAQSPP